ncbi:MAG: hypothetical protein ACR2PA_14540 [Hyphomicrobiaceae bacterium]
MLALIVLASYVARWFAGAINLEIPHVSDEAVFRTIILSAVAYALLLAIPFIPGLEIAVGLIVMAGPDIVWLVYASTLAGLTLSYGVGRLVSPTSIIRILDAVQLSRASDLLREVAPLQRQERLAFLLSHAPNKYVPFLLKHRYLALALALNIPGNFLIGGGGGIAMIAGLSRLFSVPGFVATVAIAALPIPLGVHLFGSQILAG